jgi:type IV pilus assembly protein PilY1
MTKFRTIFATIRLYKKIILFLVYFILALILRENPREILATADMTNYCYSPPTISETVAPNVMVLVDFSGSMGWCAYNPNSNKRDCCNNSSGCGWTYRGDEEGYFIPDKVYRYVGGRLDYWEETNGTPAICPPSASGIDKNSIYQGSCLNFHYMRRIDLLRWALTGGRPESCKNNPQIQRCDPEIYGQTSSQLSCDDYGCILWSESGEKVKVPWDRINGTQGGLLFQLKYLTLRPRFGVMPFAGSGIINQQSVYIGDFVGAANYDGINPYKNTITNINFGSPSGGAPTGPALWDTYNYFAQNSPQYGGLQPQTGGSVWKNPLYQCFDENKDGNCQGNELKPVPCAKNFVILITDGQWNIGAGGNYACSIDNGFESASADPVVPAYWLHKRGFTNPVDDRKSTFYVEAIYGIGLWLGGTGELALKNIAMYGSFDRSKTWPDNLTDYPKNSCWVDDCSNYINSQGKGSPCTPLPTSSPDWDRDRDGVPDTFFAASNAKEIKSAILSAIYDILRRASSGATVATLSQRVSTGALVLQPYFYPRYQAGDVELSWIGFLKALWVDAKARIREDTVADKILKLLEDLWVQFVSTTSGTKIFAISNETFCTATERNTPEDVTSLFEAGCKLAQTNPENRKVYVNKDGALVSLTDSALTSYVQSMWSDIAGKSLNATCIINYILGQDNPCPADTNTITFVSRPRTADISSLCPGSSGNRTWKLGDIYHATPVVLSYEPLNNYHLRYGDSSYLTYINSDSYRKRSTFVFVGANDGMLHAFRVGWLSAYNPPNEPLKLTDAFDLTSTDLIGKEEWAFIPRNALPYLLWLGHKDYCHVPTVDYRVSVFDAKDPNTGQWRTYLLGMMGFGGKAISANGTTYSSSLFFLDLTDWLNGASDRPTLKWEITLPDNTLTLSYPQVVKLSNGTDWSKTYVVIGSGPKEVTGTGTPYTISFVSQPKIYFIRLADGGIVANLTIPDNNKAVGHLRAVDFDNDYIDDLIYFGTYNETSGNLYRISFKNTDGSYKDVSSLTNSDIKSVFSSYLGKPVFSAPQMTFDQTRNLWVVFGTGQYLTRNYPSTNYFVGFKDTCYLGNCTINFSNLVDRTNYCTNYSNYNATLLYNSMETTCTCTETGCSQTSEGASYQFIYSLAPNGWYHVLTVNEQMYSSVFILNYMVNALSFRPTQDICSSGGETYYWMVCLAEGCPCYNLRGETSPVVSKFIAFGAPPIGQPFQPLKTEKGTTLFTQTSAGGIIQTPNPLRSTLRGKFILWIEK